MKATNSSRTALTDVLFPGYRRRVLGLLLLHPGQRYHVREIARLTGTMPGTLTRELSKLSEAGLLERSHSGNQVLYSVNPACPVIEELSSILRKTSGVAEVLAQALAPLAARVEVAFVFGSMASGKAQAGSDVDVLLIGDALDFGAAIVLLHPQQQVLEREINPKVFTRGEWRRLMRENGAFVRDIMSKPKLFIVGDERELGKLGENRPA